MSGYSIVDIEVNNISNACYLVERGKPLAVETVHIKSKEEVVRTLEDIFPYLFYKFEYADDIWVHLYIWKYPHIGSILDYLPNSPKNVFDHWVLGKLFGYDEASIAEFLDKSGHV